MGAQARSVTRWSSRRIAIGGSWIALPGVCQGQGPGVLGDTLEEARLVGWIGDLVGDGAQACAGIGDRAGGGIVRAGRVERLGVGEAHERAAKQAAPAD